MWRNIEAKLEKQKIIIKEINFQELISLENSVNQKSKKK